MRARARPKPAGLGIRKPDGLLRVFAVAKLVILRVRARARPKPAGLGIRKPDGLLRDFAVAKLVIYVCALAHGLSLPA